MPVSLLSAEGGPGFAPVTRFPFVLGCAPDSDLIDGSAGVAPVHASLAHAEGAYRLAAGDGCNLFVGGRPLRALTLRDGVVLRLARDGARWRFRRRMRGEHPDAAAWLASAEVAGPAHGSRAYGAGPAVSGRDPDRCRRVETTMGPLVVKRFGPVRTAAEGDDHLSLLAAIGGAPHDALAPLVDGGLELVDGRPERWAATRWIAGTCLREVVEDGGIDAARTLRIVRALAAGLAHLHARGVVHRDVAPGNVVLQPDGRATLIDYGQAVLQARPARASAGVVGTPGFVAPEEVLAGRAAVSPAVDVYGLGAVAYALLVGTPPARGDDLLATLGQALRPPLSPRELGVELPDALEALVMACLSPDRAERPDAAGILRALEPMSLPAGTGDTMIGDSA